MDEARSPFWNTLPPDNPYATPFFWGMNQFATVTNDQAHPKDDSHEEEEEVSLGGQIVSPSNAYQRHQALSEKISPSLDITCFGDAPYHGETKGYIPLTMSIVQC
jgi:hypothetical protein